MVLGSPQAGRMFLANVLGVLRVVCGLRAPFFGVRRNGEYLKRRDLINGVARRGGVAMNCRRLDTAPCWGSVLGAVTRDSNSMTQNLKETLSAWRSLTNKTGNLTAEILKPGMEPRAGGAGRAAVKTQGEKVGRGWQRGGGRKEAVASIKCQPKFINHGI
ncbi:hypothetical protein C8F04DRAFT_1174717 [Mycena alexandri]|uniref:Uncharacterized protein n=1 Tax=Mycena alexandri TaxID=1745969 RepID=A0AAD6TI08_9AGAR|nr:hypothetical protein C8F04DRAFT_1174717 [Mycena alexandri]